MKAPRALIGCIAICLLASTAFACSGAAAGQWNHKKQGRDWCGTCKTGKAQSPINIPKSGVKAAPEMHGLTFQYEKQPSLKFLNLGYTAEIEAHEGSKLVLPDYFEADGALEFALVQVHLHGRSEHAIDGRHHEMEAHFVHSASDGRKAVVAVFLAEGPANPVVKTILQDVPIQKGDLTINLPKPMDLNELLPRRREYFHYKGSLTTPPCTEPVSWFVMEHPVTVSSQQIQKFHHLLQAASGVESDARLIQKLNGRTVFHSRGEPIGAKSPRKIKDKAREAFDEAYFEGSFDMLSSEGRSEWGVAKGSADYSSCGWSQDSVADLDADW